MTAYVTFHRILALSRLLMPSLFSEGLKISSKGLSYSGFHSIYYYWSPLHERIPANKKFLQYLSFNHSYLEIPPSANPFQLYPSEQCWQQQAHPPEHSLPPSNYQGNCSPSNRYCSEVQCATPRTPESQLR